MDNALLTLCFSLRWFKLFIKTHVIMYLELLMILLPLALGYAICINDRKIRKVINKSLAGMVYAILFLMGASLSLLDNLSDNLNNVFYCAMHFFLFTILANVVALTLLNRCLKWPIYKGNSNYSRLNMALETMQLCAVVIAGFLIGLNRWSMFNYVDYYAQITLAILLFLIGLQLRSSGINIRQIIINKNGLAVSLTVALSALCGGAVAAFIIGIPISAGLSVASGYGWYSLSGSVLSKSLGPVLGSAAFFNDLARELLAITLIPTLMKKNTAAALGLCGATSMDFTLPVLQRSGGNGLVPTAIVHGFVLSLLAPILMAIFSQ